VVGLFLSYNEVNVRVPYTSVRYQKKIAYASYVRFHLVFYYNSHAEFM